ncbi:MAG TPA: hypothetical protein VGG10_22740 [Rhizomicrobium sp.]
MTGQTLYVIGSLVGVMMLVGLNALLFGTENARIATVADAVKRLRQEIADFYAADATLDITKRAALLQNARNGVLYLVVVKGNGLVTRALKKGALKTFAREGTTLSLRLADFTLPRAKLTFADEAIAEAWEARLKHALA